MTEEQAKDTMAGFTNATLVGAWLGWVAATEEAARLLSGDEDKEAKPVEEE